MKADSRRAVGETATDIDAVQESLAGFFLQPMKKCRKRPRKRGRLGQNRAALPSRGRVTTPKVQPTRRAAVSEPFIRLECRLTGGAASNNVDLATNVPLGQ